MKKLATLLASLCLAALPAMSNPIRIYSGHNATGSAIYAYDPGSGRLFRGHNATGSAASAFDPGLAEAGLAFLAEKLVD